MKEFNIHISQIINDNLIGLGFFKRNTSLTNFKKFSTKIHYTNNNLKSDVYAALNNKLIEGVLSHINNCITLQLMDCAIDTILDLRGLSNINKVRAITNGLAPFKYHNMITNCRLATELTDSPMFNSNTINITNTMNSEIYNIGIFNQNNLYVNKYISYKDYRIVLFDDIDINIGDMQFYDVEGVDGYNRFLTLGAQIDFKLNDNHLFAVMDEINTDVLSTYRETKIDEILNGDI